MAGTQPALTADLATIPLPRRPLDRSDQLRRWYENELGWPVVPGAPGLPLSLRVGPRFDVLDVPLEAGRAALRHLTPSSPVAVRDDRMRLLLAAGSAQEVPGVLAWLEWGTLPLDLAVLGEGDVMRAPLPPEPGTAPLEQGAAPPAQGHVPSVPGDVPPALETAPPAPRRTVPPAPRGTVPPVPGTVPPDGGPVMAVRPPDPLGAAGAVRLAAARPGPRGAVRHRLAPGPGVVRPLPLSRSATVQGAAVWLRPPEPGDEAEASLPTLSALGGGVAAPDLVRVLDTVATQCHRLRLRRASARPSVRP